MNRKCCAHDRLFQLFLVLIAISSCSINATAQDPAPALTSCRQTLSITEKPIDVSMKDLQRLPENYFGKTVTVEGKMHWIFSDNVFTIQDNGFLRDKDILVISTVSRAEAVTALQDSIEPGKSVRITGVVQPYDRGILECAYGPLHLESHEGHSFTKNPVLIVDRSQPSQSATVETPPDSRLEKE